jgi:AcrR family transcriptional regulator
MGSVSLEKLRRDEREKRREIILLAAQELFSKHGIAGVNMRDIAREAGVSVGFIYRYFAGQTDIFLELLEAGVGELGSRIDADIEVEDGRALHRLARTYIGYLHENMMFYQMMAHFMLEGKLSVEATERVNLVLRQIIDRVEVIFRRGAGEGNPRILAHSFFATLNGVMISFVNYPGRTPEETRRHTLLLAETIADRFDRDDA